MDPYIASESRPFYRATRVVWYIESAIEILLGFRLILKLLGANPNAGFTSFIYGITQPLVYPFFNVFGINTFNDNVFEWPTLLAMIAYWLLALLIIRLFLISRPVTGKEAAKKLNREDEV